MEIKSFLTQSARVLRATKKPNSAEYKTVLKISALGITAIGIIGFILALLNQIIF